MPAVLPDTVLAQFVGAARSAERAEDEFRKGYASRLQQLERDRAFAHRRLGLMTEVAAAVAGSPGLEEARLAVRQVLLQEFGLASGNEAHQPILAAFDAVSDAIHASSAEEEPAEPADVATTLATFEAWYEARTGTPFLALYDVYVPMTPVVDF